MTEKPIDKLREVLESEHAKTVAGTAFASVNANIEGEVSDTGVVRVDSAGYDVLLTRGDQWRGATTEYICERDVEIYRAAGREADGSLRLRVDRGNPWPYSRTGRIESDGSWSTETIRPRRDVTVRTTARGVLGDSGRPIELTRVATRQDGSTAWSQEASTSYVADPDHPDQTVRKTSGSVVYADGVTGTFETLMSVQTGGYHSVSTRPGRPDLQSGSRILPDGTKVIERTIPLDHGGFIIETETKKVTKQKDTGGETRVETKTQIVTSGGKTTSVSTETTERTRRIDHETGATNPKGMATESVTHTTYKDAQGKVTTTDEVHVSSPGGREATDVKRTEHPDGSTQLVTISRDGDYRTMRRTQEVDNKGNVTSDKTERVEINQSGHYQPWNPDTGFGDGSETTKDQGSEKDKEQGSEKDKDGGGGGSDSGDSPKVAEEEDSGLGADGDDEAESSGDPDDPGGYGDDTGPSGLSWDGQSEGPLSFLRDRGESLFGSDDPYRQCDDLGMEQLAPMLADALRASLNRPSPTDGLGEDTPGLPAGVTLQLGTTAKGVADPWGDWGDFSNPKAHRDLLAAVRDVEVGSPVVDASALESRLATIDLTALVLDGRFGSSHS